jgi:molybdopterin-binding protein
MGARPPAAGGSGDIHLPLTEAPEGTTVHAWLGARDIALALLPASDISIQNQLPGRVADIVSGRGRCVCVVELSEQTILVEVTLRAVHELSLAPGKRVWCLFKSHTLRVLQD